MTAHLDNVPMPARIAALPRNKAGYPIPWFVAELDGGVRDFRIADTGKYLLCVRDRLCWICGDRLGAYSAFVIGPMCAVNRISAEPPSHKACAVYAAQVCPFLTTPTMRRRTGDTPADTVPAAGEMIERNPGVTLVWITRWYTAFRPDRGNTGLLMELGDPTDTLWYAHGRDATRAEVLEAMESGMPALRAATEDEAGVRQLARQYEQALTLVPRR